MAARGLLVSVLFSLGLLVSVLFSLKKELTSRQEARERRIVTTVKPFAGTLRVTNPARKSRASSRKRVLHDGGQPPLRAALGSGRLGVGPPWGQTEFQVNLKLGLTSHACIQSPGHSQDGPSNHAPTRSVCTAAAVASLRARFSHSCGINVSLASLGRYARTCERYHGLFSPGSRPTGSSQTLSASPTGLRARWACGLMVLEEGAWAG